MMGVDVIFHWNVLKCVLKISTGNLLEFCCHDSLDTLNSNK